jgi:hypothetical protein
MRNKGEIRKFEVKPLTLDDILTKDGLEAVSTLTSKEPYYVVGGIATQSYLPSRCRRPTSDIDISIVKPLNYEDFKLISKPVIEFLSDNDYDVQTKKHSRSFSLDINNKEGEKLLIEFSRRNKKSFDNSKKKLERELENSKRKIVENGKSTYVVSTPEDIIVPKLARTIHSLMRRPDLKKDLPKERISMSEEYVKKKLKFINEFRNYAVMAPGDLELAEELRFISDIYDIRILSELAGINADYFCESARDWEALCENSREKKALFNSILPEFNHECNVFGTNKVASKV